VGKSTLFNRLTRTQNALVADQPGLTRDRKYGKAPVDGQNFLIIDTGGVGEENTGLDRKVSEQTMLAVSEADVILLMVDVISGISAGDSQLANALRRVNKTVFVVANKCDDLDISRCADFYSLGLGDPIAISASHGRGVGELLEQVLANLPLQSTDDIPQDEKRIRVAVIGKPNVGKSTLVNSLFGEQRVLVYDEAGTTRDATDIGFEKNGVAYTLIDTAGVRRRARVSEKIEKFSVVKSLQAIDSAHVVIFIMDAREPFSDQDASLLGFVHEAGRALVVAANKSEQLSRVDKQPLIDQFEREMRFVDYAKIHFISALENKGLSALWRSVDKAYANARADFTTPRLTRLLEQALEKHPPPLVRGRRIKLRYAHQGGQNPPTIVVHGNQTEAVPVSYQRYLTRFFYRALQLSGTPLRVQFKKGDNPFAGRKNTLTPRQQKRRKRLMLYTKGKHRR